LEAIPEPERQEFCDGARNFLDKLVSHLWLDGGKLVVAHAGMKEEMQGGGSGALRGFALYGETTGETDEYGLPVRLNWAAEYRGRAMVVYGHTPTPVAEWINGTICNDTGCVFGGKLIALRYPERELVEVPAARVYMESARPLDAPRGVTGQQAADTMLDIEDVQGKRTIVTHLAGSIRVEPENAAAALEVMSRFAVDPRRRDKSDRRGKAHGQPGGCGAGPRRRGGFETRAANAAAYDTAWRHYVRPSPASMICA
jgi:protein phosphatase